MTKRITVLLDDDVYSYLLARAGSTHKISETLNPLVRAAVIRQGAERDAEQATVRARIAALEQALAQLKAEISQQE